MSYPDAFLLGSVAAELLAVPGLLADFLERTSEISERRDWRDLDFSLLSIMPVVLGPTIEPGWRGTAHCIVYRNYYLGVLMYFDLIESSEKALNEKN